MTNLYRNGHLVVAAIRVLSHRKDTPPSVEAVAEALDLSLEKVHRVCNRLSEMNIIELVEGAFGTRLFVRDHQRLETLPDEDQTPAMADAIRKFQQERQDLSRKVDAIKAEQAEKRKHLYAELEKQLRRKTTPTSE